MVPPFDAANLVKIFLIALVFMFLFVIPRNYFVFALSALFLFFMGCEKDEQTDVEIFHDDISQLAETAIDFIDKAIAFETTIINSNSEVQEVRMIMG